MNAILGNRIKEFRCAKLFTQEQIAEIIGVSRQKYARIENGTNSITLDILAKLADAFGVTVRDITKVLDEEPIVAYRSSEEAASCREILDMLDLFYANKHLYTKLQR